MKVVIFGAYGFLGRRLLNAILDQTDWEVVAVSRKSRSPVWLKSYNNRVSPKIGDIRDYSFLKSVMSDVDVAYYLVHFMGHKSDNLYDQEQSAAKTFARAAKQTKLKRVIYMGGLADGKSSQSEHLRSRYQTGEELRKQAPLVIEFRAAMIIGKGSVAFDIIDNLARKTPILILPKSTLTNTQPIAVSDTLKYLVQAASVKCSRHSIFEIGGSDIVTYEKLYRLYLEFIKEKQLIFVSPLISIRLEVKFLNLFIPKVHTRIGKEIMESLTAEMVVRDKKARKIFPNIKPMDLDQAFSHAAD